MESSKTAVLSNENEVLISRVFNAPRDIVFGAWVDPDQLSRWYAPYGCRLEVHQIDAREGGSFHHCMHIPDGHKCWSKGVFHEITRPERLVLTMVVTDQDGGNVEPVEMGMDPEWPRETTVTVTFADQGGGRTLVTLHQTVSETIAKRTGAHPSWIQMLDRLDDILPATGG